MEFGSIDYGCVLVGGNLTLLGFGVITLETEVGDVVVHGKATGELGVLPLGIDADVQVTLPVFSDFIVLFEGISKVAGMAVTNIFNNKVVNDEVEDDRAPFVAPKTRSGGAFVVSVLG